MTEKAGAQADQEAGKAMLRRELEAGLASGKSKRSPEQIRAAFRKAREAA